MGELVAVSQDMPIPRAQSVSRLAVPDFAATDNPTEPLLKKSVNLA
jgi:hypothetical protein